MIKRQRNIFLRNGDKRNLFCLFVASHCSNSRGVAILFNNNFEFKVNNVQRDPDGNFNVILHTKDKELLLVNMYGPNRDSPDLYENTLKDRYIRILMS